MQLKPNSLTFILRAVARGVLGGGGGVVNPPTFLELIYSEKIRLAIRKITAIITAIA
jgi:hypothetical protein